MKNKTAHSPHDVPHQLFFDFFETGGKSASSTARTAPAARPVAACSVPAQAGRLDAAAEAAAPLQALSPRQAAVPQRPTGAEAFVTEARAAELFMDAARMHGRIQRAEVCFKPFRATLYSFRIHPDGTAQVKYHVAFRRAPELVLMQASRIILQRRRGGRAQVERTAFDRFVRAIPPEDFQLPGARRGHRQALICPGRHHSLTESFTRINTEYFQSRLEQPELCWSPARARRMLGSYHERNDRLIISQIFDSPKVPAYVLDYLMFHELLHKFLGIGRRESGRRELHGADFRRLERTFRHFAAAQQFLRHFPA